MIKRPESDTNLTAIVAISSEVINLSAGIRYLSDRNKHSSKTYLDYDTTSKMLVPTYYSKVVDESSPKTYFIGNSTDNKHELLVLSKLFYSSTVHLLL